MLEARDRVGGTRWSQTLDNGAVVEMGAEFILPRNTLVRELVERFGLELWDKGMRYGRREPRGVELSAEDLEAAVRVVDEALAAGAGRGESVRGLLDRLALDPVAKEMILARAEVSAASPADLVPARDLAGIAHVDDEPVRASPAATSVCPRPSPSRSEARFALTHRSARCRGPRRVCACRWTAAVWRRTAA